MRGMRNTHGWLCKLWILVLAFAICAVVGLCVLSPSEMRFWRVRALLFQSLGWSCLVQFAIVLGFIFLRRWMKVLGALGAFSLLLVVAFIEGLTMGPDLESVRRQAAEVTGIPASNLDCVGGRLSREAVVVFKAEAESSPCGRCDDVPLHSSVRKTLGEVLQALGVISSDHISEGLLKFPMEFNTVFALRSKDGGWWVLFFRNVVM